MVVGPGQFTQLGDHFAQVAIDLQSRHVLCGRPQVQLGQVGLQMPHAGLGQPECLHQPLPGGQVGFLMARSELNIATWVEKGLADAGAFSNRDWGNPTRMPESFRTHMRLIAQSDDVPRAIELTRGDLADDVRAALSKVLLDTGNDAAAAGLLRRYFGTTRFAPIEAQSASELARLGERVLSLRREVE